VQTVKKQEVNMGQNEIVRLIQWLKKAGFTGDEINEAIIFIESGVDTSEEKPQREDTKN